MMSKSKRIKRSVWERTKKRPRRWSPHMFNAGSPDAGHRRKHESAPEVKRLTFDMMTNEVY